MRDELLSSVDPDEIAALISELVRIPTQNPPGNEKPCSEFIVRKLKGWGIHAELVPDPCPDRPQAWAEVKGEAGDGPTLVLNGHMDVVPEGDRTKWKHDPYGGEIADGRVYGRGANDMKAGLAVMMIAAKLLNTVRDRLAGKLVLQFAVGEETGEPGTRHLVVERGLRGDYGIVLEPTQLRVATAEKGLAWFHVLFRGKPTHASAPERGINAIEKAMKFCRAIEEYAAAISDRTHPLTGTAKCSVTMIQGGTKENVIPESCAVVLDRRMNPGEQPAQVQSEIKAILDRLAAEDPDLDFAMERTMLYESAEVPTDCRIARILRRHAAAVANIAPEPHGTHASTDVRNLIIDGGMEAVTFGPGAMHDSHTIDESTPIETAAACVKIVLLTALELFSGAQQTDCAGLSG